MIEFWLKLEQNIVEIMRVSQKFSLECDANYNLTNANYNLTNANYNLTNANYNLTKSNIKESVCGKHLVKLFI